MNIIDFKDISELKKALEKEKINCIIHSHDTCGGQFFGIEGDEEKAYNFIETFFENKKIPIVIDKLAKGFRPKK